MKSILMLVNEFYPLPVGGAERQAERLSAWLAQHGWRVQVITRGVENLPDQTKRDGYLVTRPRAIGPGKIAALTFMIGALYQLWKLRDQYRILHAHLAFGPAFVAVLMGRLLNKQVLVKLGNSGEFGDIHVSQRTLRGRLRLAVFRRWVDRVIVLDEVMVAEAMDAGFEKQKLIQMNNGINAQEFIPRISRNQAKNELGLSGKMVVLFIGRLASQKSLPTLVQAFSIAQRTNPDLYLVIVGAGPERSRLEAQANQLGLAEQISFAGNQVDVKPYLAAADIFALPSSAEGISNALLEAMSAGLACLATPSGGTTEVLDHGRCGVLAPVGDISAWASALTELGNQPEYRKALGIAAQKRIADQYDISVIGKHYEDLYTSLLANEKSITKTTRLEI